MTAKASMVSDRLRLFLWGTFRIADPSGRDLTPKLAKAQALLALLATDPNGTRTRAWLKARLWSSRGEEQAAGSLRQALASLRKALGPDGDALVADRQRVALDLARIDFVAREANQDFLAGLDVRDDEFEDWLRQERRSRDANVEDTAQAPRPLGPVTMPALQRPSPDPPAVVLLAESQSQGEMRIFEAYLVDLIARSLRENFAIRTFTQSPPARQDLLVVQLRGDVLPGKRLHMSARCHDGAMAELLWSGQARLPLSGALPFDHLETYQWLNEIVDAIAGFLGAPGQRPTEIRSATHLGLAALRELFSMEPLRVALADRMLSQAYEIDPRAIYLAWRAQLRGIQAVERHAGDGRALREQGLEMAHRALQSEPNNSSVLATTANARQILDGNLILDGSVVASDVLSQRSIEENPSNPLAWWARSMSLAYSNRPKEALKASMQGHALARRSPYRFWWDMQLSISACATGQTDLAILAAERCAVHARHFRPPLRYLVGLHAAKGNVSRSLYWAKELARIEDDFTPDRLLHDDYPASVLRNYAHVSADHLRPVSEQFVG